MKFDSLSIRILRYIMALAEEGNFTKASEKLFIAQPSLSQAIRHIEQEIGVDLFVRSRSGVELTREGEAFLKAGESILDILFQLDQDITNHKIVSKDVITIGTGYTLGTVLVHKIVSRYRKKYPQIDVRVVEGKSRDMEAMTIDGQIDACIVLLPLKSAELKKRPVASGYMVLAMSKSNPMNQYAYCCDDDRDVWYFDLRQASSANFVMAMEGNRTEEVSRQAFKKSGFTPHVSMRFRNVLTGIKLVEGSNDLLIIPDVYLISNYPEKQNSINYYRVVTGNEDHDGFRWTAVAAHRQDASQISSSTRLLIDLVDNDKELKRITTVGVDGLAGSTEEGTANA